MSGEPDEGIRWMRVACLLDPMRQDLRCALAAMEVLRLAERSEVLAWAAEVRERWTGEAMPLVHATVALHKAGRGADALLVLLGLIADAPDLPAAEWRAVGGALMGLGRLHAASEAFERALAEDGEDAQAWLEYAVLAMEQGRVEQAAERLERACALDPVLPGAEALRAALTRG